METKQIIEALQVIEKALFDKKCFYDAGKIAQATEVLQNLLNKANLEKK